MLPLQGKPKNFRPGYRVKALGRWFTIIEVVYTDAWQTHFKVKEMDENLILNNLERFEYKIPGLLS